jgi:hypothetical protein
MKQEKIDCKFLLKHPFILKTNLENSPDNKIPKRSSKRSVSNHYDEGIVVFLK